MAMCLAVVRLYACGSVGTTCASTDTDTQEANNSPTKGLQGGFVIPFSLVYTAIAPLSGVAVSPAGTLQHSRAPIRCQILGCFQATYIRPRGKRASNALKDVLSLFEGERSSVCFLCPCEWREGEREAAAKEVRAAQISNTYLAAFDVLTRHNERRTAIWPECGCIVPAFPSEPIGSLPSSWLSSNWARPQAETNGKRCESCLYATPCAQNGADFGSSWRKGLGFI